MPYKILPLEEMKLVTAQEDNNQVIPQKHESLEGAPGSGDFTPRELFGLTRATSDLKLIIRH